MSRALNTPAVRARVHVHTGFLVYAMCCELSVPVFAEFQQLRCQKNILSPHAPSFFGCLLCLLFSVICCLQCLQTSHITAGPIARCHGIFWMLGPEIPLSKQRLTGQGAVVARPHWRFVAFRAVRC